jgi:1-aminocyclopropane-1-carboxylate deaminase/D-cysteine desulfhydrase-like pyridoxal-dependent ACC family enzyme
VELTPVQSFGEWYAKRDDLACYSDDNAACGSKVRQYLQMAAACPGVPMLVGCSAFSAQQIYVADAANRCGRRGFIVVPKRRERSRATEWCAEHGAKVIEISPGYPSVYRKHARELAADLGAVVRWRPDMAVLDTAMQCINLPAGIRRLIVPVGSGLVAAGLLVGTMGRKIKIRGVAVSGMATRESVIAAAEKQFAFVNRAELEKFKLIPPTTKYETPAFENLPDGTPLDPYYAAKAVKYLRPGDCLWITGRRPLDAFPKRRV